MKKIEIIVCVSVLPEVMMEKGTADINHLTLFSIISKISIQGSLSPRHFEGKQGSDL